MEKVSCALGLLLILFVERQIFKYKREINFYPCLQPFLLAEAVLNLALFFFYFDWL